MPKAETEAKNQDEHQEGGGGGAAVYEKKESSCEVQALAWVANPLRVDPPDNTLPRRERVFSSGENKITRLHQETDKPLMRGR